MRVRTPTGRVGECALAPISCAVASRSRRAARCSPRPTAPVSARSPVRRVLIAVLTVAAVAATVVPWAVAQEVDAEHPLLQRARQNVEEVEAQLQRAGQDRDQAAAALEIADAQLAEVEQRVNEASNAVRNQEIEVALAGERLEELEREAEALEASLADMARLLFVNGSGSDLEVILASGDVQAAIDRTAFLDVVSETDRVALEEARASQIALAAQRERFDAEMERLQRMQAEEEALLASVEELRATRAATLAAAEREVDDLEAMQDDLSDEQSRIEELIRNAATTPVAASTPSSEGYIWPVCATVTSNFGYRWGRQHKGIDVGASTGTPIGASKAGVVIHAGRQGGYGNLVLIDHGDGVVTAYAHQSEIIVVSGQRVDRGERIGSVGNTGNSTGPHLHLETRLNGTAVDPRGYLPSSC